MKHLLILIMALTSFFKLFGQDKPASDPYWVFDEGKHFRPQLDKGEFYKLSGFDFGWFVLEPISKFVGDFEHEVERNRSLSFGQKALYYWWYVDAQVTNGGFVQFYYNDYGKYVPAIIKSLNYIGDVRMAGLIARADKIYQREKKMMDKAKDKSLFGSDLYDRLEDLSEFDSEYYKINEQTMSLIEKYIRKHPGEFCVDESGNEFNTAVTGVLKTFYPDGKIKAAFTLEDGAINGGYKSFYENGKLKEDIQYLKGSPTGERTEYYENGNKKYAVTKNGKDRFEYLWYHENGARQKLEFKSAENERSGEYKEWYDNGQLKESGFYTSDYTREGPWLEFYSDGRKKLEAEFKDGDFLPRNFWNEKGEQTLKDGNGLYAYSYAWTDDRLEINEDEYRNFKRHGVQKSFVNGVLTEYKEMEDGKQHGYSRSYYKNGKLKEETLYQNGESVGIKTFPKSDNLVGKVEFQYLMKEEWLTEKDLPTADTYPVCINEDEIRKLIKTPASLFELEHQDREGSTCLWLSIDEKGNVTKVDFRVAYLTNGDEFLQVADKMKFMPAKKDGKNVPSFIYIIANFTVE